MKWSDKFALYNNRYISYWSYYYAWQIYLSVLLFLLIPKFFSRNSNFSLVNYYSPNYMVAINSIKKNYAYLRTDMFDMYAKLISEVMANKGCYSVLDIKKFEELKDCSILFLMSDDTENDKYGSTISRKIILTNPPVNIEDKLFILYILGQIVFEVE